MDEIYELNQKYFQDSIHRGKVYVNLSHVEQMIKMLTKQDVIKVQGLSHAHKTATVFKSVSMMGNLETSLYFNSQVYKNSRIKSASGVKKFIKYVEDKKAYSINTLIFESIEDLKDSKNLISDLFKESRYKIILIGALKHLHGLSKVHVSPPSVSQSIDLNIHSGCVDTFFQLGALFNYDYSDVSYDSLQIRNAIFDSCIFRDLISTYGIKDVFLYLTTLNFLSRNIGEYLSLRDITKILNEGNMKTSVITITDYVNHSVSAGILHKLKRYDFKKEKKMDSKGSYYFGDMGILASARKDVKIERHKLLENCLYLELLSRAYELYSGVNGKFQMSFYAKKLDKKLLLHVSSHTDKKEIKKELNKLAKIQLKADKYLVVESLPDLGLRKKDYEHVKLLSFVEVLKLL